MLRPVTRGVLSLALPEFFPIVLRRLFDDELRAFVPWARTIPIEWGSLDEVRLLPAQEADSLPHILVAASHVFGRSSLRFDPDKGSFCFPLLLTSPSEQIDRPHIVMLRDVRGAVRFEVASIDPSIERERGYRRDVPPLSAAEIAALARAVIEFLTPSGEVLCRKACPFYRKVRSEWLVYGCRGGESFARAFDDQATYDAGVTAIARELDEQQQACQRHQAGAVFDHVLFG